MNRNKTIFLLIGAILLQVILIKVLSSFPEEITRYYTNGIYPMIAKFQGIVFSWVPFSVGDLLYTGLIIYILWILITSVRKFKERKKKMAINILGIANLVYFCFHFLWGLNYYKLSFEYQYKVPQNELSLVALNEVTHYMIDKANALSIQVNRDDTLHYRADIDRVGIESIKLYPQLASYLGMTYTDKPVKKTWYTYWVHSILGVNGYYNPFTGEAQIKGNLLANEYGNTINHEIAHQLGFASESEASYIGAINCLLSEDVDLRYSAYYSLSMRLLYEVKKRDVSAYKTMFGRLNEQVRCDMQEDIAHFKTVNPFWSRWFEQAMDWYLKLNSQEGVVTYSQVTRLIINQYLNEKKNQSLQPFRLFPDLNKAL